MDAGPSTNAPAWLVEARRISLEIAEALDFAPLSPDIEFVAYLRALSQFGFFRFGPITIDVNVVEDILMRTHPRGEGGPEHPGSTDDFVRQGELTWRIMRERNRSKVDELTTLLVYMQWGEGLSARVFGELGISPDDIDRYTGELSSGHATRPPASEKLYSTESAAAYLDVHIQTVRSWIRSGKLPASRLAGQKAIRIRGSDLEAVLEPIEPTQFES